MSVETHNHSKYMALALAEAQKGSQQFDEVPIGAVVVLNDEVIATSHNLKESQNTPTGHAELIAVEKAAKKLQRWRLSDCTLYVTLEPCPMCAGAIVQARIKQLVYGAKDPKAGAVDSLYHILNDQRLNHQVQVTSGVLTEECSQVLKEFFQKKRAHNK